MTTKNPLHIPSAFQADQPDMTPEEKEQQYVHSVYQAIAPHFSATRYKPWPVVEEFLMTMPVGYVGADIGCGNGKYIGVNDKLFMVGSDRSSNLISICGERGHEAMVCDGLALPYRSQFFDFAISIAVIHHFISPERRVAAIEEILRIVRVGGRVLIFVWALEQTGKRDFDKETQDVFVPWALAKKPTELRKSSEPKKSKANSRPQGVKKKDRKNNNGGNVPAGQATTEQDEAKGNEENADAGSVITDALNKLTVQEDHTDSQGIRNIKENSLQDQSSTAADSLSSSSAHTSTTTTATATTTSNQPNPEDTPPTPEAAAPVYNRYYHLFHKGELEDLVLQTNKASIVQQGYDRDNWWCILEKTRHE
ncbi:tRNA methyltransferase, has a role in tRNA modification [Mortierella hygrophila]|uniref:tRNA methyltransferase, has a role in tRNA modification n=1 Tax=Mortierella hygrophila TaxID=979708 RepID=A0A9P6EYL8_9FUNG|nr:tRNA methyltransferase, has a role in tRNA modification [Mortierella hygrophila]